MDNVLIDRSMTMSGFDFRQWTAGDGCRSLAVSLPPPRGSHGSYPYASPVVAPPFQYAPYLHSSLSLPPLPPRRPPVLPLPPRAAAARYAASPPSHAARPAPAAAAARRNSAGAGEGKRKKPRAPRAAGDEPPMAQRRRPLERAVPLPSAPAVVEALDDLEREVCRGFVEDLMDALAPPPSSLPLPTFSLVRAKAAAATCAV